MAYSPASALTHFVAAATHNPKHAAAWSVPASGNRSPATGSCGPPGAGAGKDAGASAR